MSTKSAEGRLLELLSDIQQKTLNKEYTISRLFEQILQFILEETGSEYGFIGRVVYEKDKAPYLKTHAITDISWNRETETFYKRNAPKGLVFSNLKTLFGRVILSAEAVISNNPAEDPRSGGLPPGHPPMNSFAGIPIEGTEENRLAGMIGIANRPGGYSAEMFSFFRPLLLNCAALLEVIRSSEAEQAADFRSRNLLESIGEACWEIDLLKVKVLQANKPTWELFDCTEDEFYKNPQISEKSAHPEDSDLLRKQNYRLLREGHADFQHRIVRKNGDIRNVFIRKKIIRNEKGHPTRLLCIAVDLSSSQKDREKLRETEKLYEQVFDTVPQAVFILNKSTSEILSANRSAQNLFAHKPGDLPERSFFSLFAEKPGSDVSLLEPEKVYVLQGAGGESVYCEITAEEIVKGGKDYFLVVVNDISERYSAAEKIENLLEQSRLLNEELFAGKDELSRTLAASEVLNRELLKKQDHLRAVQTAIPDVLLIFDEDGRIIDVSHGRQKERYRKREEVIGRTVFEVFPQDIAAVFMEKIELTIQKNALQEIDYQLPINETLHTFEGRAIPLEQKIKGKNCVVWIARDITQRVYTEKRFELIFETTPIAFIISDREGKIRTVNRQAQELFAYTAEEMIGSDIEKLIPSRFHKYHKNVRSEYVENPDFRKMGADREVFGLKKDGSEIPVTINLNSMETGQEVLILSSVTDISGIRKQADNLKKLTEDLLRRNKELEEFAYIISHNVRAPVANMLGLLAIYDKSTPASEFNMQLLEHMGQVTQDLDLITHDLNMILDLKRHVHDTREEVNFPALAEEILHLLNTQILRASAEISLDFSQCTTVYSVKRYLRNILLNLVENALKFRSPARPCQITIRTFRDEENFCLEVRDNGLGINMEQFGYRLFGLYNRSHTHVEGKGLGLHLVKTQVEALGGKVGAESRPDKGSIFSAYIPLNSSTMEI